MKLLRPLRIFPFAAALAFAQTPAPTNTLGAVTKLDAPAHTLTLRTDAGLEIVVTALPSTDYRRVAPGVTDISKAAVISMADISVGDRVLARGLRTDQSVTAPLIVVMSAADLAGKQAAERADWSRRGVLGVVTAVAPDSITIRSRTLAGTSLIMVTPTANAVIRRYAPGSVNFADATVSGLSEIKAGDQVRARGNKTADGNKLAAEEIVSGTFRTIAAVIAAVNPEAQEIRVTDLDSKKVLAVKTTGDSNMRRLSPPTAAAIAKQLHPEPAGGRGGAPGVSGTPPDFQQMLETSDKVTLADLKTGAAIVVSCSVSSESDRVTAITLLAGVEVILTQPGTQRMSLGNWALDIGQ